MSGELWREVVYAGKETTAGSTVIPTRKLYLMDVSLTRERAPRPHKFATGTRDNQRAFTLGPAVAGGAAKQSVSADENLEWLLCGLKGNVSPTHPGTLAYLWTFTPGTSLDSMTWERYDGARYQQARGIYANKLTWAGNVREGNELSAELFGLGLEFLDALSATPADRVPTFIEGWETKVYIDALGGTPGTTLVSDALINWNVSYTNGLARKYFANNSQDPGAITIGELDLKASFLLEASASVARTEFDNWDAGTGRLIRLEFGQNSVIDAGTNEVQTLTITGSPAAGTTILTYAGQSTVPIAYNATAAIVQSALRSLSNIGPLDVVCGGGPWPGTAITVTFQGRLASTDVAAITNADSFTGGSAPALAVTTTTPGVAGYKRYVALDLPGYWSAVALGSSDENTRAYEFHLEYTYDTVLAAGFRVLCQSSRSAAW